MRPKAEVMRDLGRVCKRQITIQRRQMVPGENGNQTEVWVDWQQVCAECSALWGRNYYAALAVGEERTVEFVVPAAPLDGLTADDHRIVEDGQVYDIRQLDPLRDDGLWIKIRAMRLG